MNPTRLVWLVAIILGCAASSPRAQSPYGQCGYIWVGGNSNGDSAYGWAMTTAYYYSCSETYDIQVYASVTVSTPLGGYDQDYDEGYAGEAYADAAAPLQQGETGFASVSGTGALCFFYCQYGEYYQDSYSYQLSTPPPPPPPDPPSVSLSSTSGTANWNSPPVLITANVSPPGQGYEAALQWEGGYAAESNLQRWVSTESIGSQSVTAYIASETTATATVSVEVQPYVTLSPAFTEAPVNSGDQVITADVQPSYFLPNLVWSTNGNGYADPGNPSQFLLDTSTAGEFWVEASLGLAQTPPRATVSIQIQCLAPPLLWYRRGVVPGSTITYRISPGAANEPRLTTAEQTGIREALQRWRETDLSNGIGISFLDISGSLIQAGISIYRDKSNEVPPTAGAATASVQLTADGHWNKGYIIYSRRSGYAVGQAATRRLGLHELGHVHGLGDTSSMPPLSTVMVATISPSDNPQSIPEYPGICDSQNAAEAAF